MHNGNTGILSDEDGIYVFEDDTVRVEFNKDSFTAIKGELKNDAAQASLQQAAEMMILYTLLYDRQPFAAGI